MATLSPEWSPILLTGEYAPIGTPLFQPVIQENAVIVAGGPLKLSVFQKYNGEQLWFEVPARVWISGFTINAGQMYVQDGPVLSVWDLTFGGCKGAMNLATEESWDPVRYKEDDRDSVPEWVYILPEDLAGLQTALTEARQVAAWAAVLEAADRMIRDDSRYASGSTRSPRTVPLGSLPDTLRSWLGGTTGHPIPTARAALDKALAAAGAAVFSAPVVRTQKLSGQLYGQVFALGGDGTLCSLDAAIMRVNKKGYERPARPHLTMSETKKQAGPWDCRLYYITASGGIQAINASADPSESLPGWAPRGGLRLDRFHPLRYVYSKQSGGRLFGGGIFDAYFFALTTNPADPPVMTAKWGNGWSDYDIAAADQLVLLNPGFNTIDLVSQDLISAQMSSAAGVCTRKRSGVDYSAPEQSHSLFWDDTGTGSGGDGWASSPLLSLEIDSLSYSKSNFRVYLANTIDSADPQYTSRFPPKPIVLDSGTISKGNFTSLPELAWIRSKPAIAQQSMYCIARSHTFKEWFASLVSESPNQPWRRIVDAVNVEIGKGRTAIQALSQIPVPRLVGEDALVAFALGPLLSSVQSAAQAGMAQLNNLAQPIRIQYCCETIYADQRTGARVTTGPLPISQSIVTITAPNKSVMQNRSDRNGLVTVDNGLEGWSVEPFLSDPFWNSQRGFMKWKPQALKPGLNTYTVTVNYYD